MFAIVGAAGFNAFVVQTGRLIVDIGLNRVWDSFAAVNGGPFDTVYGKGVFPTNVTLLQIDPNTGASLYDGFRLDAYIPDNTVFKNLTRSPGTGPFSRRVPMAARQAIIEFGSRAGSVSPHSRTRR